MFGNVFKRRPKKFLGVDIGTTCIRVVETKREGKTLTLGNYGEFSLSFSSERPFRAFKENVLLLSNRDIAQALQTICLEAGIQTKETNFSIPDFSTFFTNIELPSMRKEELSQAVKYEVRPYIPLPLSEITLDWAIIEGETSKTPLKILVAAISNDIISQYKEVAVLSNLKLKVMEPEVFSLARPLVKNEKEKKILSLIDIGARTTTCSILDQGVFKISHSFYIGGNELTEVLTKSLDIGYNKATELKKRQGLLNREATGLISAKEGFKKPNVREILLPLIDSILGEIKKVFRDFYQNEGKEIEKVILAGGTALLPGLKEYFAAGLKKEVVIINPFLGLAYPPILEEVLKKMGPAYAVAVGAALKGFE